MGNVDRVGIKVEPGMEKEMEKIDRFAREFARLKTLEAEYDMLLDLVTIVSKQNDLSMEQSVTFTLSKKDIVAAKSWREVLEKYFEDKQKGLNLGL